MFSENYVYLCAKTGEDPTTLAEKLGYSRTAGSKWCKGAVPRKKGLALIADHFGVTVEWLLADHEKTPAAPEGDGLDSILMEHLRRLTPEESARVLAFVQGILSVREA